MRVKETGFSCIFLEIRLGHKSESGSVYRALTESSRFSPY